MAFFSDRSFGGSKKSFPPFQVHGNDAVTEWSLPANVETWIWTHTGHKGWNNDRNLLQGVMPVL